MQQDELMWEILHPHCRSRAKTKVLDFCRDPNNVTGLCNRASCPLANSRYATIRESGAKIFLYVKTAERSHTPKKLWQKIRLSSNYSKALKQINKHLEFWPNEFIFKIKQRLTRIFQYLIRVQELSKKPRLKLIPIRRKAEKVQKSRAARAEIVARIDNTIEDELLKRLQTGTYGQIYNFPMYQYNKALEREVAKAKEVDVNEEEFEEDIESEEEKMKHDSDESEVEYVEEDIEISEDDIEDIHKNTKRPLILTNREESDESLEIELEEEYEVYNSRT